MINLNLGIDLTDEEKQPFNLRKPDSRCPKCKSPVKLWQNIPILSYVLLGGKCHSCKTAIGIRYPLIELLTSVLFGIVAWQYGWSWATIGGLILTAILIALTFIDADTAKKNLEEGKKVRYGNERNYARYLERINGLEKAVRSAQENYDVAQSQPTSQNPVAY